MPRANRHFAPGHVWRIQARPVPIVQVVQFPGSSPGSVINRGWNLELVGTMENDLGVKAIHRDVLQADGTYALREPAEAYADNSPAKMSL